MVRKTLSYTSVVWYMNGQSLVIGCNPHYNACNCFTFPLGMFARKVFTCVSSGQRYICNIYNQIIHSMLNKLQSFCL